MPYDLVGNLFGVFMAIVVTALVAGYALIEARKEDREAATKAAQLDAVLHRKAG